MYSVVIPSSGRFEFLRELLESIDRQSVRPSEVIILLDDNEHCRQGAISVEGVVDGTKITFCSGLSLAAKRNLGAEISSSEFILYSDDDDIWDEKKGEAVASALAEYPACCHNYGKMGAIIGDFLNSLGRRDKLVSNLDLVRGANVFGGGSTIAARRSLVALLPFASELPYCEDFDWWARVLAAGIPVRYLGASLVRYRVHSSNMTGSAPNSKYSLVVARRLFRQGFIPCVAALSIALRALGRAGLIRLKTTVPRS